MHTILTDRARPHDVAAGEQGQTMAEYGVVLAVITLVVVAAVASLSGVIDGHYADVGSMIKDLVP